MSLVVVAPPPGMSPGYPIGRDSQKCHPPAGAALHFQTIICRLPKNALQPTVIGILWRCRRSQP